MYQNTWRITEWEKKIRKKFQESYESGNKYVMRKIEEKKSKERFIDESGNFFIIYPI